MDGSDWRWNRDEGPGKVPAQPPRRTGEPPPFLVMLLIAGLLVAAGWLLVRRLDEMTRLQNCALQGRTNCVVIEPETK
ncbi:MAG: hypothetical protein F8N37_23345 [Telmatospirillum sp.]|nr:hypothetical protein [Telmatospirillum sp.]